MHILMTQWVAIGRAVLSSLAEYAEEHRMADGLLMRLSKRKGIPFLGTRAMPLSVC